MIPRRHLLVCFIAMMMATPAVAVPWVRAYVVGNYEPAFHFGGKAGYGNSTSPGSDCAKGTIIPEFDFDSYLKTPWRSHAEIADIVSPPGAEKTADNLLIVHYMEERAMSYRGFRRDIETFVNPFAAPDPGMEEVTGKIAEGFNLDNNPNTGGFTSPSGQKGIDNAYYRSWGCIGSFRGKPYTAGRSVRANDKMLEGLFTIVIRVSGNQSPMNDTDATVEIGYSPDHIVKDATSNADSNYSFRIVKSAQYTRLKATIKNGVVESEQVAELHAPKFGWFPNQTGDMDFHKGKIRFAIGPDGKISGLIGGYRNWIDLYVEDNFTQSGGTQELLDHQNSIGMYYALKRNADGMPDPKTGENMGISIAYRFKGVPAYVIDPSTPLGVTVLDQDGRQMTSFQNMHDAFAKAVLTKAIQKVPVGSAEAAPQADELMHELPAATLQRLLSRSDMAKPAAPQLARNRQGTNGATPNANTNVQPPPAAKPPAATEPKSQVNNGAPSKLASAAPAGTAKLAEALWTSGAAGPSSGRSGVLAGPHLR